MALGDILLPEGRTVSMLVKEAIIKSFQEAGYRVQDSALEASPIVIDINKFWSWMTPGFWRISLDFQAEIEITGDVKGAGDAHIVKGEAHYSGMVGGAGAWTEVINKGVNSLTENTRSSIK